MLVNKAISPMHVKYILTTTTTNMHVTGHAAPADRPKWLVDSARGCASPGRGRLHTCHVCTYVYVCAQCIACSAQGARSRTKDVHSWISAVHLDFRKSQCAGALSIIHQQRYRVPYVPCVSRDGSQLPSCSGAHRYRFRNKL